MKKLFCFILLLCLLAGCNAPEPETTAPATTAATVAPTTAPALETTTAPLPQYTVGISLPEQSVWQEAADELIQALSQKGCQTELRFANLSSSAQLTQLEELIAQPVDCLVVVAIDSVFLAPTLSTAKDAGIPVVAWDRMLMDAEGIACCISFDYGAIGAAMGQAIVRELSLSTAAEENRSYTVEFFMGSAENHSALLLHRGLMEVLEPYLLAGVLDCRSSQISFEDSCIQHGDANTAKFHCSALIQRYYAQELRPDVIVTGSNQLAHGCIQALTELGCTQENWPLITGQGSGTAGLRRVVSGKQALTLWCNTLPLTEQLADAVSALLSGAPVQAPYTVNNHTEEVPVLYCAATEIRRDNIERLLVDTGIYTLDALTE